MRHEQSEIPFGNVTTYIENGGPITITNDLSPTGKLIYDQNIKLDDSLKGWLKDISTASDKGVAAVARDAISFFKLFYPIHRKMLQYRKAVYALLKSLP